jgi:hypothetical protein
MPSPFVFLMLIVGGGGCLVAAFEHDHGDFVQQAALVVVGYVAIIAGLMWLLALVLITL